ncbi:hypothetical protein BDZ94DRAFT_1246914 [Collybia nuda]|uniref:Nicotinamide-nucleotide adenylyltransferase n=1 Tax=Collybia nuda TaxID=64659 RepID=A0A9P6CN69_9AGAR|nr:hypothetical protein BDZ94DRAFT_1246914 [Collybia nuda]
MSSSGSSGSISPAKVEPPDMAFTRASTSSLLHRVQHGLSSMDLIYSSHDKWPIPHPRFTPLVHRPLRILVLDSSYNPPTLAHLALANSRRPTYSPQLHQNLSNNVMDYDALDYDAKLLLLSVRNADKVLKAGDASYLQRLEMMELLTKNIVQYGTNSLDSPRGGGVLPEKHTNVAIAIIDEPTFVKKSRTIRIFLQGRFSKFATITPPYPLYNAQLTFLLGLDTLERLISPRYYPSKSEMLSSLHTFLAPDGDDSRIVCARRPMPMGSKGSDELQEERKLNLTQDFISTERILLIDIEEDVRAYSSSTVRNTIARLGLGSEEWKKFVPEEIAKYIIKESLFTVDDFPQDLET